MPRLKFPHPLARPGAVLAACVPSPVLAADGQIFSGATVSASVAAIVALGLLLATIHYRRRLTDSETRVLDLENRLQREQALLDSAPQAIICWDTGTGDQKLSPAAVRMTGCAVGETVGAEQIAAIVSKSRAAGVRASVGALIASGTAFDDVVPGTGGRRYGLSGRSIPQVDGGHLAVLWLRDDSAAADETAAAQRQADSFLKLLDSFPFPVWRRQRSLDMDYVNPAYREAVEADPDKDPGDLSELAAASVAKNGRALAVQASETRDAQTESHNIVAAGARRLMELTETPIGGDGAIGGFAIDRTETQDIRTELARHIENHEQVLHNLGTAIAIFGADRRLEFYNTAYVKLWDIREAFLDAKPTLGEILEELREARKIPEQANFPEFKAGRNAMFTSLLEPLEELTHLPDGKTLRSVAAPHPFGGLLITWEDVTASLALERSYNTLIAVQKETLDNLYEAIAVIGGDGRLQLSNPAFGRIWQLADDEIAAAPHISELVERMRDFLDQGDWETQKSELINLLTDREGQSGRIERADGSVIDFATVPLPDGAMLLSYVDVSDSHRVEQFLRERNEALETADRLKSEFIANVSYELRTPLNTIVGFSEILTGEYFGDLNDRQTEYGKGIYESSQRLLSLINDILDLATIESGHMSLELEAVDVHSVLDSVLGLTRERVLRKSLKLDFDCPEDIGLIMADERRLKQAMFNILSNSVKFTPEEGEITVSARRVEDNIIVTFTDTGIGIAPEDHERIFDRFERGDQPEARRSGVGLGLSLVQSFIALHGGHVELESAPGVGTKVVCRLPARRTEEGMPQIASGN
jgi:signal transduction histidine kinase